MTMIELRTLGDCQILVGGERLGPQSPHAFALALFLAVERGRPHARDELLAMFFPGVPEGNAAHSLRQTLYKLRQLGVPAETTPAGTMLAAAEVRDDYSALLATGELPDARAARLPGQFLPGYWPRISDEFARWLEGQRDAVSSALRRAYVSRILDRRAVARWDEVERYARACLVVDPLNEEATLALAEALALSGSKAAGVKVLDRYLEEVGREDDRLTLPATVLRKRISERVQARSGRYSPIPLVGRDAELRLLSRLTANAHAGQSGALLITGEPGIGKTRLIREHAASLQLSNAKLIEAACQPHDARRPLSLLVDLVPQLIRRPGALGAAPDSLALLQRLYKVGDDESAPIVAPGASADELAATVTDALSDVIDALSATHLVVFLLEDLHWADGLSRRVVSNLIAETKHRRFLAIITSREQPPLTGSNTSTTTLRLQGLPHADSAQLITTLIPEASHDPPVDPLDKILHLAGGNPFYLHALCDYFRSEGNLNRTPPILSELLGQRLAGLQSTGRTAFAACVLLGRWSSIARVEQVLGTSAAVLADALTELENLGLVTPRSEKLEVHHALLAHTLLDTESLSRLSVVRRAVAGVLEREAEATSAIALYWDAAEHWLASGDSVRAKSALRMCALHAANMGAAQEAIQAIERYDAVAADDEAIALSDLIRAKILRDSNSRGRLLLNWPDGRQNTCRSTFRHDLDLLAYEISRQHRGDGERYLDELRRIVGDCRSERRTRIRAASMLMCIASDLDDAELATQVVADLPITPADYRDTDTDMTRLLLAYHTGFGDRAIAQRLAKSIADWPDLAVINGDSIRSLCNAAMALSLCGDMSTSADIAERAFRLCTTNNMVPQATIAAARRYWIARQIGDVAEADQWIARVEGHMQRLGLEELGTHGIYCIAINALDNSIPDQAHAAIQELARRTTFTSRSSHWANHTAMLFRFMDLSGGAPVNKNDLADALHWSLRTAPRTPEDDVALGVAHALWSLDRGQAKAFVADYLRSRRPGAPILPPLGRFA